MTSRAAVACTLVLGCGVGQPGTIGGDGDDSPPPGTPDTTPPQLVAIAPVGWLHQPIRITLDEPLKPTGAFVRVELAGAPVDATLAVDGSTITITLDPAARGTGTLAIAVRGVCDRAGNAADPIDAAFELAAWDQTPLSAAATPAIAVASDGTTYAAWPIDGRILVTRDGARLGPPLSGAAPALTLDDDDQPIVGYLAGDAPHVARWDRTDWRALPSPLSAGSATAIALGRGPTAAVLAGDVTVSYFAGSWKPVGRPLPAAGRPMLADGAIAWIAGATLVAYRYDGTDWAALPAIAGAEHASIARRGDAIAVAWDQRAGSYGVLAALLGSTGRWQQLGRTLDVDVAGDAREPAVAIDSTGAPIVAWHERIETAERGVLARWDGARWTIAGGASWLPDPAVTPTAPVLALHPGDAPVVAWNGGIARSNATVSPTIQRAALAGCAFDAAAPPARVLATGCFTLAAPGVTVPHAGLVPYGIVVELWSDGANKRRWIGLRDGASFTTSGTGAWAAPVGTFIVKQFDLDDPAGARRAIETRVLVRSAAGWQGFSYRWRLDGSDADLMPDGESTYDWPLAGGGTHRHLYPSRSECVSCHESSYGPLLGLRPQQLARWFDYDGTIADQLPTLAALGVGPAATATPFISPHDPSATAEQRMRGYMAANCAHCHNPLHISIKDLRYPTPLAQTGLCDVIVPGDPADSIVYQKVTSRPGMPALGTLAIDPLAADMLASWITGMRSCP